MGAPNNALNVYMAKSERVRSILEYYLGERLPPDWTFQDVNGFYSIRNSRGKISYRQRDGIKRVCGREFHFLLGLENQQTINLIYPWRLMELDCLAYGTQIETIQEKNIQNRAGYGTEDDFKYRYKRQDLLEPVLNLTLYWGKNKWIFPLSLKDMLRLEKIPERLQNGFGDYKINLIHMRSIPDCELQKMNSDLKYVLGIMKHTGSRKKYQEYIMQNKEYFSHIPKSALDVIDVCTGLQHIREHLEFITNPKNGEEEANMCKAVNDIVRYAEKTGMKRGVKRGTALGMKQGLKQGISQGTKLGMAKGEALLAELMNILLTNGRTEDAKLAACNESARKKFYKEFGL